MGCCQNTKKDGEVVVLGETRKRKQTWREAANEETSIGYEIISATSHESHHHQVTDIAKNAPSQLLVRTNVQACFKYGVKNQPPIPRIPTKSLMDKKCSESNKKTVDTERTLKRIDLN